MSTGEKKTTTRKELLHLNWNKIEQADKQIVHML